MYYTYAHYTPEGRLFYIGKGHGRRAYSLKSRNDYWKHIVNKYGKPVIKIIAKGLSESEAFIHEIKLIKFYRDSGEKLCNMTGGGEGSLGVTPWNKGKPWSEEIKSKQGIANLNNKYWLGRKHSEETKQKQRLAKAKYKFIGTNVDTNEIIILIGKEAIKKSIFTSTHVYRCAKQLSSTHKGYTWRKELLENN